MERVYHVHVVKVGRSGLICQIDRMLERQIPYGERLKLGIARPYAPLMFMIKLAQAYCHFTAAGARGRYYYKRPRSLYIFILAVAMFAYYKLHIAGITVYREVPVYLYPKLLKPFFERVRHGLIPVLRKHNAAYIKPYRPERVYKPEHVKVIRYAKVAAHLVLFYIRSVYGYHYLCLILKLHQHPHLAVRLKARQHP